MRVKNSIRNVLVSIFSQIIIILIGFISQKIFVAILGTEILGLNGLLNNIISMLSIAEMGMGTAIIYALYKPISERNNEKIKTLMAFYKSCYNKIAIVIFLGGLLVLPFINNIVGTNCITYNVYHIYMLFLIETVVSYLLTYKRSILYADQKNYIIEMIHLSYLVLLNIVEIIILLSTKNYILYLIVKIVFRLLENIVINIISIRKYPYIKEKNVKKIEPEEKKEFFKKIRGLFLHKISWNIINGTDNIIISKFVGISWVGLYSNYLLIINTLEKIATQIFSSITGSVGNLIASETKEKAYEIYKKLDLLQFIVYSILTVGVYMVSKPFVELWLGKNYILQNEIVLFICLSFFIQGIRRNICVFKDAAGIFYEDRKMPIIASTSNIIISVMLVKNWGMIGVFIGTIICYLFLHICSYPKYIYEKVFDKSRNEYRIEFLKKVAIILLELGMACVVMKLLVCPNVILQILLNGIIAILITGSMIMIIYHRKKEYQYLIELLRKLIGRVGIKKQNVKEDKVKGI